MAEVTSTIRIGTLVWQNDLRHPAITAMEAATLDVLSGGRAWLGIGAGWHPAEFNAFGLNFSNKVDQFEEATRIIAPLVHQGPAAARNDGDFAGAGGAVAKGIGALAIDVEIMVRVLDRRDAHALRN